MIDTSINASTCVSRLINLDNNIWRACLIYMQDTEWQPDRKSRGSIWRSWRATAVSYWTPLAARRNKSPQILQWQPIDNNSRHYLSSPAGEGFFAFGTAARLHYHSSMITRRVQQNQQQWKQPRKWQSSRRIASEKLLHSIRQYVPTPWQHSEVFSASDIKKLHLQLGHATIS